MNKLGDNIRVLRKESGLSIRELSLKIGISHNTLAAYERNVVIPTVPNAVKICEFFKVPVEYLIYGKTVVKNNFKDNELLALAIDVIELKNDESLDLSKKYLKKVIENFKDKKKLIEEVE
ncbi:helix-turn-helix transcriptional regulator [Candidatus Bathyarchaeota archaeon]|nr:helix-turn-helix transcriptional regulator [Candidatus Bathyarchaeota archaeon]